MRRKATNAAAYMGTVSRSKFQSKAHAEISAAMKPLLKMLDHKYLNDIEGLENPTIENMAEWFWKKLESQCPGLCEIVVHETPTARCVYRGE